MGIREYNFVGGVETPTLPSTTTPTVSADLVNLGYLQTYYAPQITGTPGAPSAIVAGTGIAFTGTAWFNTWYVQGSGGAVDISANPQITAGTNRGQRLRLVGCSDANTVKLEDGTGLSLNGTCILENKSVIELEWDGTVWMEVSRR